MIFQLAPESLFAELLSLGLYVPWPLVSLLGVSELKTQRSDEPVSKSRFRTCAGVPIDTGVRYSVSNCSGVVVAVPVLRFSRPSSAMMASIAVWRSVGILAPNLR